MKGTGNHFLYKVFPSSYAFGRKADKIGKFRFNTDRDKEYKASSMRDSGCWSEEVQF